MSSGGSRIEEDQRDLEHSIRQVKEKLKKATTEIQRQFYRDQIEDYEYRSRVSTEYFCQLFVTLHNAFLSTRLQLMNRQLIKDRPGLREYRRTHDLPPETNSQGSGSSEQWVDEESESPDGRKQKKPKNRSPERSRSPSAQKRKKTCRSRSRHSDTDVSEAENESRAQDQVVARQFAKEELDAATAALQAAEEGSGTRSVRLAKKMTEKERDRKLFKSSKSDKPGKSGRLAYLTYLPYQPDFQFLTINLISFSLSQLVSQS